MGYVVTGKIEPEEKKQLMSEYGLRDSEKSMEFRGKRGELRLVIGKKGSKRYCLIVGPYLSPIQAFALAIINIETS